MVKPQLSSWVCRRRRRELTSNIIQLANQSTDLLTEGRVGGGGGGGQQAEILRKPQGTDKLLRGVSKVQHKEENSGITERRVGQERQRAKRERERERERDRQTHRQTDRDRETETERETDRQTDRQTDRREETEPETDKGRKDRHINKQGRNEATL